MACRRRYRRRQGYLRPTKTAPTGAFRPGAARRRTHHRSPSEEPRAILGHAGARIGDSTFFHPDSYRRPRLLTGSALRGTAYLSARGSRAWRLTRHTAGRELHPAPKVNTTLWPVRGQSFTAR